MELIDKAVALKTLRSLCRECQKDAEEMGGEEVLLAEGLSDAIDIIADVPVVRDVVSVVHGRWIMRGGYFRCSVCDAKAKWNRECGFGCWSQEYVQAKTAYCHNCGAKMGKEEPNGN